MPPRAKDIESSPAMDILNELLQFVDAQQAIPNEHALYEQVLKPRGYDMTLSQYRYFFSRLRMEGYISVEPTTRAIRVHKRRIVDPDS